MFKYVGTEQQLIELGFDFEKDITTGFNLDVYISKIGLDKGGILIMCYNSNKINLRTSNEYAQKLFCEMYKQNLIIWVDDNDK